MQVCSKMEKLGSQTTVEALVPFTRFTFAELLFDKPLGKTAQLPQAHPENAAQTLGAKLAAGLELLCHHVARIAAVKGPEGVAQPADARIVRAKEIEEALSSIGAVSASDFPPVPPSSAGDESWMQLDPGELDKVLRDTQGELSKLSRETERDGKLPQHLEHLMDDVDGFIGQSSEFDGPEPAPAASGNASDFGFDPERMMGLINQALGGEEEDEEEDGEDLLDEEEREMQRTLDEEIATTSIGQLGASGDAEALKNLMMSLSGQGSNPGPLTSILGSMKKTKGQ